MVKFDEIIRDAKNNVFYPIYFLYGEESFFIDEITNYLEQNILDEASKSFNQTMVYGRDVVARDIVDMARRFPMMGNYQVVIVKEAQAIKDIEELEIYLDNLMPSTILIINYKYKKPDKRKKFFKRLSKSEDVVFFESNRLYDNQIPRWISDTIKIMGYSINPMAAALLSEYIGNDLNNLANEIGKLIINLKEGEQISEVHVEENIGISKDFNIFELQKALTNRDALKTQRIVQHFEANPKEHPLQMLTVVLNNFFVKVYTVHHVKGGAKDIASELGISPFFANDYIKAAKVFSAKKIEKIISEIREVDLKARGLGITDGTSYGPLKELVFNIIN
ncbi:MAG: DNA polymerase III subunit delta [Marinilabiliales bacterium]|nr:MAG: DNA polymerase III subunit delta [Marinilabiliales bacterium]